MATHLNVRWSVRADYADALVDELRGDVDPDGTPLDLAAESLEGAVARAKRVKRPTQYITVLWQPRSSGAQLLVEWMHQVVVPSYTALGLAAESLTAAVLTAEVGTPEPTQGTGPC